MKVALKDIHPNPWRYINKGYPIDPLKIKKLRASIRQTGFWDNLVARKNGDKIEIAYGHHRIEALRKEFNPEYEISVILRELDDASMLKIMAQENYAMGEMSPLVMNETVRATRDFLQTHPEELKKLRTGTERWGHGPTIALFLGWPIERVENTLAALKAIEKGEIIKEEYEAIPYQRTAETYRKEIKKTPLPTHLREKIIEKIKDHQIGFRGIKDEILKAKLSQGNHKERKKIELDDLARQVACDLNHANLILDNIVSNWEFVSEEYKRSIQVSLFNLLTKFKKLKLKKLKQLTNQKG